MSTTPRNAPRKERPALQGSDQWITLFADASFCPDTRAYGWCFWIKHGSPAQTVIDSGGGANIGSSGDAELEALRHGIRRVHELDIKGKRIVIQSDCTGALALLGPEIAALKSAGALVAYTKHVALFALRVGIAPNP